MPITVSKLRVSSFDEVSFSRTFHRIHGDPQPDSVSVNITVSKEPRIVVPFDRLNHDEGTNATFTCSIGSGELRGLTYEWKKDDIVVTSLTNPSKLRIRIDPENYQSVLRVIDLQSSDAGLYSCTAKNSYGQDKVSTRLSVKGKSIGCTSSFIEPNRVTNLAGLKFK